MHIGLASVLESPTAKEMLRPKNGHLSVFTA